MHTEQRGDRGMLPCCTRPEHAVALMERRPPSLRSPFAVAAPPLPLCPPLPPSQSEAGALRRLLPNYEKHLRRHPETLIAKFFGCTKLKLYTQDLYFVVMENVFRRCKTDLHERYDLKVRPPPCCRCSLLWQQRVVCCGGGRAAPRCVC